MSANRKLRVAVVGLGFGSNFLPGYLSHPQVETVGLCDTDAETLDRVGDRLGIRRRHGELDEVLSGGDYDAVNLFTPIHEHADQAVSVLEAGLHCASAVPMATTLDDLRRILDARNRAGRNYMMMETAARTDEFLFLQDMHGRGEFGRLQFLRGVFYHNLENHPDYWMGLPPMHYTTHPIAPMLALAGRRVESVCCLGSGRMRQELRDHYGNPYPVETAIFGLHGGDLAMEVTSITFETAVVPHETFDVYGETRSFRWGRFGDQHALVRLLPARPGASRGSPLVVMRLEVPSAQDRLPAALRRAWLRGPFPHLVDEFVRSIVEGRPSAIDAPVAARWTAPGICAHESALQGGRPVNVPQFE